MGIVNVNLPATDAWKELMKQRRSHNLKGVMGNDGENMNIEDVKLLYKLSEDGEYAMLYDVYEEGMEIERGIVVPLSSTYNRTETVPAGTKIVNVVGSSGDTVGNTNCKNGWLVIYKFITGIDTNICCTDGCIYPSETNIGIKVNNCNAITAGANCIMHGGHVIIGKMLAGKEKMGTEYNRAKEPGAYDVVAIMPICASHNNSIQDMYMYVRENTPAMVLNYTIMKNAFQNYIK